MKLFVGSFLAQTLKKKKPCIIINQSDTLLRSPLITAVYAKEMHAQWLESVRGLEELSRQPRIEWDVADRAIKFLLQAALKAECTYTFQSLLGHQLMKLSTLLSSSSDSQYKTRALRSVRLFTANPGATTDRALLKNASSFFNIEKSLWHIPSKVIWWQFSF